MKIEEKFWDSGSVVLGIAGAGAGAVDVNNGDVVRVFFEEGTVVPEMGGVVRIERPRVIRIVKDIEIEGEEERVKHCVFNTRCFKVV